MNIKEQIRAEIERRIDTCYRADGRIAPPRTRNAIVIDEFQDLLTFLDTLPDEECFADISKTSGVPKKERPKVYEATCVDFDDDGTPIFYGDGKVPDLELDDKITFRLWWKKIFVDELEKLPKEDEK